MRGWGAFCRKHEGAAEQTKRDTSRCEQRLTAIRYRGDRWRCGTTVAPHDLADRPVRLGARGWDNQLWRLGDDLPVRLPWATQDADELLLKEHTSKRDGRRTR